MIVHTCNSIHQPSCKASQVLLFKRNQTTRSSRLYEDQLFQYDCFIRFSLATNKNYTSFKYNQLQIYWYFAIFLF